METTPPLARRLRNAFGKRIVEISVLSFRIGEISLVIWKFLLSEITGYIKARPKWFELMITVYYPTLIARICGWMSADLFNHIIHVSFTYLFSLSTSCLHTLVSRN